MTDFTDEELALDPHFADQFEAGFRPACQLYLISPPTIGDDFVDRLAQAFDGGDVAAFQLRLKGLDEDAIAAVAAPLQALCAQREVAFIINDSVALAQRLSADGVHLGQGDGDAKEARKLLGPKVQIGITCHDSRHLAMEAGEAGADYVAFGAFFPTTTKDVTHHAEPSILGWWTTLFELPCVAIGGVTPDNAAPLVAAGADFLAVSGAVWNHPEGPGAGVAAFAEVLASKAPPPR
ncbi:thiamine-phosphate pyrophosphorylase [Sphingobium sp. Leaf26]|uniref:thiamine phosphate synthase n=1 Tax=Sphingobium sp. Leaf26 TaxID=1735693 RepID=UPI0006F7ABB3|nr:thiamine phosphate synthase [Sphingobium sp. Leaf26]KQN00734.1 thiamine-phosphate pyrophosphorylase [Sphingobium sp. Leaf26]